jgi:hypothetical protein
MPSTEFVQTKETLKNAVSFSNYLRVFILYSCPVCRRYTIHAPRNNRKGDYYVDHKRVPVHQIAFDGKWDLVGVAAEDACFIENCNDVINIETTRTVIRVK